MRAIPLKLAPGSDLRESLQELAQQHQADGFVLGVVGNLSRAAFQCPGQPLRIIRMNTPGTDRIHLFQIGM